MFIWDFVAETVLGQVVDWIYSQLVGFLGEFFTMMGSMGAELFDMSWVKSVVLLFSYLAWALYVTGLVVAVFECGIEYQSGRGSIKDTALNVIKGFMAVSLFNTVPVELYKLSVSLQNSFTSGITKMTGTDGSISTMAKATLTNVGTLGMSTIIEIFILLVMGYAIIKVFFANLKRGGILLIQIAVGSLYMFSVPRGYIDGFTAWCKQVIGLCLTAFLQTVILTAGLMVFNSNMLLGLGLMLASSEIPRIAGQFGLDTSTKASLMGTVNAAQSAVNITRTVVQTVAK
ncbi:MAG TPA: conjugal transfer protein TrbL family protein [Ruminiclostridium sp.]|nr:conjugal transfer protein TrbL family protein [Ruminiclostridium sp.]